MPAFPIFNKSVLDGEKGSAHKAENPAKWRRRNPGVSWMIFVAAAAGVTISLVDGWRSAILAEEYLPDLQAQSAGKDGAVLALLGAKLALADSPLMRRQSIDVLGRAVE